MQAGRRHLTTRCKKTSSQRLIFCYNFSLDRGYGIYPAYRTANNTCYALTMRMSAIGASSDIRTACCDVRECQKR